LAQDLERFFGAAHPGFNWNFEGVEVGLLIADADTQDEAALGGLIDDCAILRDPNRMVQREKQHARADFHTLSLHPNQTSHQKRVRQITVLLLVMLGNEASMPAAGFGGLGLGDYFVDDACHVFSGGRILSAGQISNGKHHAYRVASRMKR
jgi:hypothetical protein